MDENYDGEVISGSNNKFSIEVDENFQIHICYGESLFWTKVHLNDISIDDMENLSKMFANAALEMKRFEERCHQTELRLKAEDKIK